MKRNHYNYEIDLEDSHEDSVITKVEDNIQIQELLSKFPEGSRERIYLEYWMTSSGVYDFGIIPNGTYKSGYTEKDLALKLGYASSDSNGYRRFRRKMKEFIKDYFKSD